MRFNRPDYGAPPKKKRLKWLLLAGGVLLILFLSWRTFRHPAQEGLDGPWPVERVVRFICDRIAVIHKGELVELAESEQLFANPLHPYTQALLSAIPMPDPIAEKQKKLLVYDSSMHHYESDPPSWVEVEPGHFLLANREELEKISNQR